jgi:hypothetical protein
VFRSAGIDALDRAGIAWHLAFTSPSLAGLWAATGAGLGVTLRTTVGLPNTLAVLKPGASGLPTLPKVSLTLCKTKADSAVIRLSEILRETIAEQVTGEGEAPERPDVIAKRLVFTAKQRCYAAKRAEPLPAAWSWLRLRQPIVC